MNKDSFAERLRELRLQQGLTQMQLAKLTGISSTAIGHWEIRNREPKIEAVICLAKFFNVTVGYMVGTED